jgi:N-acetyl-anhydromuramyl-L-alanine amidase AmpD
MVSQLSLRFVGVLSLISLISCMPANAVPGRLGGYSSGHIRHIASQSHHANSTITRHASSTAYASSHVRKHKLSRALVHVGRSLTNKKHEVASNEPTGATKSFMWQAPMPDQPVAEEAQQTMYDDFWNGHAAKYAPTALTEANVFAYQALRGGVYRRREAVKYIILHSTETGRPADAPRVIASWNHRGLRHPGAQFVVDRDGVIYNTVDPAFATVHVDTRRTISGINNDNTIGIEIVHTGKQEYTDKQINGVACLVAYLQSRYSIDNDHILTHHFVQPSDRRDPVNFDWDKFAYDKSLVSTDQTAYAKGAIEFTAKP